MIPRSFHLSSACIILALLSRISKAGGDDTLSFLIYFNNRFFFQEFSYFGM